jgi:hypothetical protein
MKTGFLYSVLILISAFGQIALAGPHSLNFGVFEESYPASSNNWFDGGAPRAHGASITYSYDQLEDRNWSHLDSFYVSFNATLKWEDDAQLYDTDRVATSAAADIIVIFPIYNQYSDLITSVISGFAIEENGPQINDQHYVGHTGIQLEKIFGTRIGEFIVKGAAEYAIYSYEVDDEPALQQTRSPRELLGHEGHGSLIRADLEYYAGKNRFRLLYYRLAADDNQQTQNGYSKEKYSITWIRELSNQTQCSLDYSVISHDYRPVALAFKDTLHTASASCRYNFR